MPEIIKFHVYLRRLARRRDVKSTLSGVIEFINFNGGYRHSCLNNLPAVKELTALAGTLPRADKSPVPTCAFRPIPFRINSHFYLKILRGERSATSAGPSTRLAGATCWFRRAQVARRRCRIFCAAGFLAARFCLSARRVATSASNHLGGGNFAKKSTVKQKDIAELWFGLAR